MAFVVRSREAGKVSTCILMLFKKPHAYLDRLSRTNIK